MYFPKLKAQAQQSAAVEQFGGLDRRVGHGAGCAENMENMWSGGYPALETRPRRGVMRQLTKPHGIVEKDGLFWVDGTALYLLRSNVVLLIAAAIGCTTGPLRLWNRVEDKLSDTAAVTLRTVGVVLLLLLSIAFLVGDSYNPFLYFRF